MCPYHMCESIVEGCYVSYIGPSREVVHIHILTFGKILDLYVETPPTGQPEPIMC